LFGLFKAAASRPHSKGFASVVTQIEFFGWAGLLQFVYKDQASRLRLHYVAPSALDEYPRPANLQPAPLPIPFRIQYDDGLIFS
jgi:hypothetical protein